MTSRVPSSSTDSPGSAPLSSRPLRSHLMAGLGIPARKRGNDHKCFPQLRTRLIQTTPAACWKNNTQGGQKLPKGSSSCYRMILTLKIFILNTVKSLLASNDFPRDFHTQCWFKSPLVWIFPYKVYMENTVRIGHFYSSFVMCNGQQIKIFLSPRHSPFAGHGNAICWLATLSWKGLLNGGSRSSIVGGSEKKQTQKTAWFLLQIEKYSLTIHNTKSLIHTRSHSNNPLYIDWNGYCTSTFHFSGNI